MTRHFNFYGEDRQHLAGVHPGERMDEHFAINVPDDDEFGEPHPDVADISVEAVRAHAQHLLNIWPDQSAIRVVDKDESGTYMVVRREA